MGKKGLYSRYPHTDAVVFTYFRRAVFIKDVYKLGIFSSKTQFHHLQADKLYLKGKSSSKIIIEIGGTTRYSKGIQHLK